MTTDSSDVVVIGAGPVGLLTALLCARDGIKVTVYESEDAILQLPRACVYFPMIIEQFKKAGVLEGILARAEKNTAGVDWKDANQNILAEIRPPPGAYPAIFLDQADVAEVIQQHLEVTGSGKIMFNHTYERAEQGNDTVTVFLKSKIDGKAIKHTCRYLIGTDGGRSAVRRSFNIPMEGFTWGFRMVAINIEYDIGRYLGWKGATFVVDPQDWAIVVRRCPGPNWRVATNLSNLFGPSIEEPTREQIIEAVKPRLRRILPGNTDEIKFNRIAPYTIHQRCAGRFREGNVLLAGDAAHLNNPVGALGLNTGFMDAAHLHQTLKQIYLSNGNPNTLLTEYAERRRENFLTVANVDSEANLNRLHSLKPEHVQAREGFFKMLNGPKEGLAEKLGDMVDVRMVTHREDLSIPGEMPREDRVGAGLPTNVVVS